MTGLRRLATVLIVTTTVGVAATAIQPGTARASYECGYYYLCLYRDISGNSGAGHLTLPYRGIGYPDLGAFVWHNGGTVDNSVSSFYNNSPYRWCAFTYYNFSAGSAGVYVIRPGDIGNVNPFAFWNDKWSSITPCQPA